MSERSAENASERFTTGSPEVARAQKWLANGREAGRSALELSGVFIARLLNAAIPTVSLENP